MHTKLFVGLTFFPDTSFAKIVDNFRARFDDKYDSNSSLHLPIVPPFEVETSELKNIHLELTEELESFYFDNLANHALDFTGLDVEEHKKRKIVFMNPKIDEDLASAKNRSSRSARATSQIARRSSKSLQRKPT